MSGKKIEHHEHQHGDGCGHTAIQHEDHVDYLHDGHLHRQNEDGLAGLYGVGIDVGNNWYYHEN